MYVYHRTNSPKISYIDPWKHIGHQEETKNLHYEKDAGTITYAN